MHQTAEGHNTFTWTPERGQCVTLMAVAQQVCHPSWSLHQRATNKQAENFSCPQGSSSAEGLSNPQPSPGLCLASAVSVILHLAGLGPEPHPPNNQKQPCEPPSALLGPWYQTSPLQELHLYQPCRCLPESLFKVLECFCSL